MLIKDVKLFLMIFHGLYGKPEYPNSGGSIVASQKLKRIDGRALPGVEPAA